MYGVKDEEELENLLRFNSTEGNYQVQKPPQFERGLLGDVGAQSERQGGSDIAALMAQFAQKANQSAGNDGIAQRQASNQQLAQQAMAQQQQQDAQRMQMIMTLAKMFAGGE